MLRANRLQAEFVEFIPDEPVDGRIYVSLEYETAVHRCCCGCGNLVCTPLTPTDWRIRIDGPYVSLHPSVGNWSFPCQSHYWVERGRVRWAEAMSQDQIAGVRAMDRARKAEFYGSPPSHGFLAGAWGWIRRTAARCWGGRKDGR